MIAPTQAQIEAAAWEIVRGGGHTVPPDEARIIAKSALTAAAEAGEPNKIELEMGDLARKLFLETIERCARVAEDILGPDPQPKGFDVAAAIRKLKDE